MRQTENDGDRWWTMIERVLSRPPLIFCLSPGTFESEAETARKELEAKYNFESKSINYLCQGPFVETLKEKY